MEITSSFEKDGYAVVKNAISLDMAKLLAIQFTMLKDVTYLQHNVPPDNQTFCGDEQTPQSFAWYGSFFFDALLEYMLPVVEKVTNKKLYPCYSYARIYWPGAELIKHKDRPSCEISTTITIEEDEKNPWPIWMNNFNGDTGQLLLNVGDMCVYSGCELEHWRDKYTGKKQIQAFLHYVDATGPYKNYIFDTRPMLGCSPGSKAVK